MIFACASAGLPQLRNMLLCVRVLLLCVGVGREGGARQVAQRVLRRVVRHGDLGQAEEGAPARAADAGVGPDRVEADLGAAEDDQPRNPLLVGLGEPVLDRGGTEPFGGGVEPLQVSHQHRHCVDLDEDPPAAAGAAAQRGGGCWKQI